MKVPCQPPARLAAVEVLLQLDLPLFRKHVQGGALTLAPPSPACQSVVGFACLKPWWLLLSLPWVGLGGPSLTSLFSHHTASFPPLHNQLIELLKAGGPLPASSSVWLRHWEGSAWPPSRGQLVGPLAGGGGGSQDVSLLSPILTACRI